MFVESHGVREATTGELEIDERSIEFVCFDGGGGVLMHIGELGVIYPYGAKRATRNLDERRIFSPDVIENVKNASLCLSLCVYKQKKIVNNQTKPTNQHFFFRSIHSKTSKIVSHLVHYHSLYFM